jgi:hypothetical protein
MGSVDETSTSEGDGRKYQVKHHLKLVKVDISMTLGISEKKVSPLGCENNELLLDYSFPCMRTIHIL